MNRLLALPLTRIQGCKVGKSGLSNLYMLSSLLCIAAQLRTRMVSIFSSIASGVVKSA